MIENIAVYIHITGIVQGVGFRPYVYNLASQYSLKGWVRNTSAGVEIWAEGPQSTIDDFLIKLPKQIPPLAHIDQFEFKTQTVENHHEFIIQGSSSIPGSFQPISPDIATCPDCLSELFNPQDRRFRYPFINCTNCGPRFTIIEDIPYDRPNTTMSTFEMCAQCAQEYHNPEDRRFHAQPIACSVCGPSIWLEMAGEEKKLYESDRAILVAQKLLSEGRILAIKGIGGFHLACDARNKEAVALLRQRKLRVKKPFALMLSNTFAVEKICQVSASERLLLESKERPIVILDRRSDYNDLGDISPNQNTLGIMLPYSPLHHLLLDPNPAANFEIASILVMTSGNLSEEPIATTNEEARDRLSDIADAFLLHNRPIQIRCDDSVVRSGNSFESGFHPIRRSRGYAPTPIYLPWNLKSILALGAELKNTFCIGHGRYAFMSHHIGDLQNYETYASFIEAINHYKRLFRITPEILVHDMHPDYLSTRVAQELAETMRIPMVSVQHHHAHIAACMAENHIPAHEAVLGAAFDGTGYGLDGAIWGGEFLYSTYSGFERNYHLEYVPIPGGDAAIRNPARIALAYLWKLGFDWEPNLSPVQSICAEDRTFLRMQLQNQINTPSQSSMGRLFDAVSSLVGVCQKVNYEAQAAIELENIADPNEKGSYNLDFNNQNEEIFLHKAILSILNDLEENLPASIISAKFHNTIANLTKDAFVAMRNKHSVSTVVLSGGVWQNKTLLNKTIPLLLAAGFKCYIHNTVPANDGGIALGQCVIAHHQHQLSR